MNQSKFTLIAGGVLAAALALPSALIQRHIEHARVDIHGKERLMNVTSNDGITSTSYKNFVYASGKIYVVKDSLWNWHFRSGTVFAQIPEQGTCDVTLSGYRWGFLSTHQNIIAAKCVITSH